MDEKKRQYDLEERLINFAARVMEVVEALPRSATGHHIADQMLRSGTAPAALYGEAQAAESRADFVHKVKLALKELRETRVWLILLQRRELVKPAKRLDPLVRENDELIAILYVSAGTAKRNQEQQAGIREDEQTYSPG